MEPYASIVNEDHDTQLHWPSFSSATDEVRSSPIDIPVLAISHNILYAHHYIKL